MSEQFHDFDFSDSDFSDDLEFESLESRLHAAGLVCDFQSEEELVATADEVPQPRASLRTEFLDEVAAIERRREQLRRLPMLAACLLAASAALLDLPTPSAAAPSFAMTEQGQKLPLVAGIPDELIRQHVLAETRAAVEAAGRADDSWALVDACRQLRARQSLHLQGQPRTTSPE